MSRLSTTRWALTLLAATLPAAALCALPAAADDGPRIERIEILILSLPDHQEVGVLRPGDVLDLEEGQSVRLRMSAIPARLRPRYPSTRFELISGRREVLVEGSNEEVGNITITAMRSDGPRREDAVIRYKITDELDISKDLQSGEIRVRVRPPAPPPPPQLPSVGFAGVILYEDTDFRGRAQNFTLADNPDLEDTGIGGDRASSIRVEPGCRVALYEHRGYRGRVTILESDVADLGDTPVGNDRVSSLTLDCTARDRARGY